MEHIENEYSKHYWLTQIINTWHLGIVYKDGSWLFLLLPQFRHSSSLPWLLQHFLRGLFSSSKYIIHVAEKVICINNKLNNIASRLNNHLWFPTSYSVYIYHDGPLHSSNFIPYNPTAQDILSHSSSYVMTINIPVLCTCFLFCLESYCNVLLKHSLNLKVKFFVISWQAHESRVLMITACLVPTPVSGVAIWLNIFQRTVIFQRTIQTFIFQKFF